MPDLDEATLAALLARAGLTATAEQKAGLLALAPRIAAMAAAVRVPRDPAAELAHLYCFRAEDMQ